MKRLVSEAMLLGFLRQVTNFLPQVGNVDAKGMCPIYAQAQCLWLRAPYRAVIMVKTFCLQYKQAIT